MEWIKESIKKKHIKNYEYKKFRNIEEIGRGGFGTVYRAKYGEKYFALKSFKSDKLSVKKIVKELKLHRDVDFHDNIIRIYGITINSDEKKYLLALEYADEGTLRNYLKKKFHVLKWQDKYSLSLQLSSAIECLHDEKIVHGDLHSDNILIHGGSIKLADFGLSKRIGDNSITEVFGIVPYIDPVRFSDAKNKISSGKSLISKMVELRKESDIYSLGVLFWELSSGKLPFAADKYDFDLAMEISKGLREAVIENTPEEYSNLYIRCWDGNPSERPKIQEVVKTLKAMISSSDSKYTQEIIIRVDLGRDKNDINSSEKQESSSNEMITAELSNVIKNFHQRDLKISSASESPPNSTPDVDKENDVTEMNETADSIAQTDSTADLIRDMVDILNDVADIYKTALHCKNITRILMERISAAVSAVILQSSEDLLKDHIGLHKLIQTLNKMKIYIDEITQYDIVLQFLEDKSIENKFKDLCKEYDDRNDVLSFAIELKTNAEKENKVLEDDVKELLKFQKTFEEIIRI